MKCIRESTLRTSDLVAGYVGHTLRALSEEVMNFFNRVEPRIYFVSSNRGEVFYFYEDSFIEIKNALRAKDAQLAERNKLQCSPLARKDCVQRNLI